MGGGSGTVDTQKRPKGDRCGKRTVNRRKGQYLVSDDWEFKTEPGIVKGSRSYRVRKGTGRGRGLIEVENLRSSQTYHLLRKKLRFTKRGKWGRAETSHEVP